MELSPAVRPSQPSAARETAVVAEQRQWRNALNLSLTTADGDQVTLRIARAGSESNTLAQQRDSQGSVSLFSSERQQASATLWQVEGDLDAGELRAINQVLRQAQAVSEQFFRGDVAGAWEQALSLSADPDEVVGFSLQLSQELREQQFAGYQRTAESPLARLGDFLGELQQLRHRAADSAGSAQSWLATVAELQEDLARDQRQQLLSLSEELLGRLPWAHASA